MRRRRRICLLRRAEWAAPGGGGEPPTKVGGLRGDILFKSKEYPLALPKKDCQGGDFDFPPDNPLETTKGRASALPLETILEFTGDFRETGAGASLRAFGGR